MKIKNEQQYQQSKDWLQRFEQLVTELDGNESLKASEMRSQLYKDSYQSQAEELAAEIADYERLINGDKDQPMQINVESVNQFPLALIQARIAAQISQQELARRLGIEEQRVEEYERTDYQGASFGEILEVCTVLGVELEMAVIRVDFEEIEAVAKSVEKWENDKRKIIASAS